ncbi:MAG: PKD domain-containing protein, partial [Deltaproteobacteria bacterium]|nr:PKD domain-containing protein [Deltaproteobacteria bacterium]
DAIVSYDWDCDNDGSFETTSATASGATCTFDDEGIYTVSMNATDATGATSPTVTATVNVSNVAPSVLISGPSTGDEGDSLVYLAIATDPSSGDAAALTFVWTVTPSAGPPSTTSGPSSLTFVPADDDTYTVAVTVTDPAAATGADVVSVVVGNVAPALTITGPSTGDEGDALTWSLAASDAGSVDNANLTTIWEITESGGTVASGTGTSVSWTPADDGAYTLSAVTTDPQSATGTDSIGITISNVSPVVGQPSGPSTGDEGDALSWTLAGSDAGSTDNAALTYAWSISDGAGTVANGTGNAVNWTPADDGAYTLTTTVTDPQSASDTGTFAITIANVAPAVDSLTGPATGDEGSTYGFDATVSDVGADDVAGLVTTWDWGDATPTETGVSLSHTWADDGVYTVTVTVDDGDGGSDTDSLTVTIGNVDPIIDTTPGATAPESTLYSYSPTVTDPGDEVFTWTLSPNAPPLMTVDGATGAIAWTPSYADALVGNFSVTLTVDDGDGGTAFQSWTIEVTVADNDADGLADGWELANGLDPNDPNDAAGDPDADGLTNLDEFTEGTDPNSYDGPSAPTLTEPIAGDETSDVSPDLFWTNATDPQNEALSYTVEVYEDSALTTLAASMTNVAEDLSGTSTWKVDLLLTENTEYWWRARATDAWVDGPWSVEESFVVNAVNEAPGLASLTFPIDGETAASASPVLTWSEATDVDGDLLTYDVEVYDDEGVLLTSTTEVAGDGTSATWQVDVALDEDQFYSWTVLATDEHGLDGDWTEEESFFVSSENGAPSDTVFIRPENESQIVEVQPELEVSVSEDPEGGLVTYEFELDTVNTFDSADLVTASGSDSVWSLADDGITLTETTWYARVAAVDEAGISSVPDTISFFVRGENDAPDVPELISPADGAEGEATPLLVVGTPLDPEGDVVFIDFRVARDAEMTDVIAEVSGVVADLAADTDWLVNVNISGTVYWTARAVDADGAASEWAGAWSYTGPSETEAPGDDDDDDDGAGCECQSDMGATPGSALAALALLLPLAWRRRRS